MPKRKKIARPQAVLVRRPGKPAIVTVAPPAPEPPAKPPFPVAERLYVYPEENMDDARHWDREYGYFGQTSPEAPAAPAPTPWYAAPLAFAMQLYQQRQMAKVQQERARAGLPPLTPEQYRAQYQPPIATAEVGLAPQTRNLLIYGGIGLAALLLLPQLLRR